MRNDKEDTILRSDAIEAVYRAYRRPSDDEVFIRMREELERVPETSVATVQANVEIDMDELVKRVTEEIRNSFILDPVGWIPCSERLPRPYTEVLVCDECGWVSLGSYRPCDVTEKDSGWSTLTSIKLPTDEVLAWMPLPKPWKGADDETAND